LKEREKKKHYIYKNTQNCCASCSRNNSLSPILAFPNLHFATWSVFDPRGRVSGKESGIPNSGSGLSGAPTGTWRCPSGQLGRVHNERTKGPTLLAIFSPSSYTPSTARTKGCAHTHENYALFFPSFHSLESRVRKHVRSPSGRVARRGGCETESVEGVFENHRRCRASTISAPRHKSFPNPKLISSALLSHGLAGESHMVDRKT